ncbi:Monodehydroascorbate reductase (NADH) [Bertholletia excelsa]
MGGRQSVSRQDTLQGSSVKVKSHQAKEYVSSEEFRARFEASMGTNKLMVIEIGTRWCGFCAKMQPAMKKFATDYTDVEFIKINADESPDVARKFGVRVYPTFILTKRGEKVDEVEGASEEILLKKIEQHRA